MSFLISVLIIVSIVIACGVCVQKFQQKFEIKNGKLQRKEEEHIEFGNDLINPRNI